MPANFLHIRKCGGSAIRAALGPYTDALAIKLHAHNVRLADIDAREPVFFSVRYPVARFTSGFNSRLRKGAPLYDRPWNAEEAEAFARFETPEQLALALGDANTRDSAEQALSRHLPCAPYAVAVDQPRRDRAAQCDLDRISGHAR